MRAFITAGGESELVEAQGLPFVAVVLALLATPGPTNTLLAASGAAVGLAGFAAVVAGTALRAIA